MKLLKLYPLIFLIVSSIAGARTVENYNYPYLNPYMASLTYEIIQADLKSTAKEVIIPGLASRSNVPLLEGRNFTKVNVYKQAKQAPLAFMLTGTGSQASDAGVNSQAEILYSMGYSVVVIPSPMAWNFILAENPTGTPGYAPDEARLLYNYMQKVMGIINADHSFKISGYVMAGYSLGAGDAAFISEIDREEKVFDFEKVLLVNPPFDLLYSINVLDHLMDVAATWTPKKIDYVESLIYGVGADLLGRNYQDRNYFFGLDKTPFGNASYDMFLIGAAFRITLGDVIFTNQQMSDTGVLKTPAVKGHQSERETEAHSISFSEFAKKLVVPALAKEHGMAPNVNAIFAKASMNSIEAQLASNPKVFIFHNADDFLITPADIASFQRAFGDRMTVFPHGGHLGNLWYSDNIQAFRAIFMKAN